ncbi:hypothetical protein, partial [Paenibacillus medicaginis]
MITDRIPVQASRMYCRVIPECQNKDSIFKFEIFKNNNEQQNPPKGERLNFRVIGNNIHKGDVTHGSEQKR